MNLVRRIDGSTFEPVKPNGEKFDVNSGDKMGMGLVDPLSITTFVEYPKMLYRLKDGVGLFTDPNEMNRAMGHVMDVMEARSRPKEKLIDLRVVANAAEEETAVGEGFGPLSDCMATPGNIQRKSEVAALREESVKKDDLIASLAARLEALESAQAGAIPIERKKPGPKPKLPAAA